MDIERSFQNFILLDWPGIMSIFSFTYQAHITVGIFFLAYMYTFVPVPIYTRIRRSIATNNWLAFVIFSTWRCMPPRFFDGYKDVLHAGHQSVWAENKYRLTIAAMPSLHFGTSAFISWALWKHSPHQILRTIAVFYPALMLSTIIATANHWILDAVAGILVVIVGYYLQWVWLYLISIENAVFKLLGVEKPKEYA